MAKHILLQVIHYIDELQEKYDEESDEYKRLTLIQETASETSRAEIIESF